MSTLIKTGRRVRKATVSLISLLVVMLSMPAGVAFAATSIGTVSLNGGATATVSGGAAVSIVVPVTTTNNDDWESTSYRIGSSGAYTCVNTTDRTTSGTNSATLNATAPAA